ncbi:MAG: 4Fe-4S binding protein, partial [Candidatus Theseobacter exili]|nr:4Fe-4S binding protein [Candidatus Theseobacter exili]
AVVQCRGGKEEAKERFIYNGIHNCESAQQLMGGSKACTYGCLRFGDCVKVCNFDAIRMNSNNLPEIDEKKCTGCGLCVKACPRSIITLIPKKERVYLACVSQNTAKTVKAACSVGCIACKICSLPKFTPSGGITMEGNLPEMHYDKEHAFEGALQKCPNKCFIKDPGELPE